ncbi:NAD(P)-dependent oxidoreductase [Paenibacillus sp. OV219]|uniref:NAD-dependent epimerase/dehydratase family protein n=1 Tax=Paenibacillus sp. OV219 TaxID=1884377 RepID=UPI0008BB2A7E|nr:NAD(P)-dependent oxidoreductase [Paenibacillus sp. OV219]SEN94535.1 Nucleoside-diphosphate-sugar epimerase [Paenibacillus sp. OV219]
MMRKRVVVTGGSGKAGKWIVKELVEQGYEVLNLDWKLPTEPLCPTQIVDLNDLGQVHNALSQFGTGDRLPIHAVIHFAAIPQAFIYPNDVTFKNNVMNTYNILEASANLGISKVVLASSESSYGIVFASQFFAPNYLPIDEQHPQLSEDSYGLSKMVNEMTGETFHRRTGMQVISFRLGNILEPQDYPKVRERFDDPQQRLRILWSYIDVRDVAVACRLAVEKEGLGVHSLILAADDTSSDQPSSELIQRFMPELSEYSSKLPERTSFLSNKRIKEVLGWKQQHFFTEQ